MENFSMVEDESLQKRIDKITKKEWVEIFFHIFRERYGSYRRDYEIVTGAEDILEYIRNENETK